MPATSASSKYLAAIETVEDLIASYSTQARGLRQRLESEFAPEAYKARQDLENSIAASENMAERLRGVHAVLREQSRQLARRSRKT